MKVLELHNEFLDSLICVKGRHKRTWWMFSICPDLSLKVYHLCSEGWSSVTPNRLCVKCHTKFDAEISPQGGLILDHLATPTFNYNNLYKQPTTIEFDKDPYVVETNQMEIEGITYKYIKYNAGISLILHSKGIKGIHHLSEAFLNENGRTLIQTKEGKCVICKQNVQGAEMRSFLILEKKLKNA